MTVDTAAMRLRACDNEGCSSACGLIRSAADEIDELRREKAATDATARRYREKWIECDRALTESHERLKVVLSDYWLPGDNLLAVIGKIMAELAELKRELEKERGRREAAEALLADARTYCAQSSLYGPIAAHFARYGGKHE